MEEKLVTGYKKLFLRGTASDVEKVLDALPEHFGEHWTRDVASEERSLALAFDDTEYRCYDFQGTAEPVLPPAKLWLMIQARETHVMNIVPAKPSAAWWQVGLSEEQYGAILDSFAHLVEKSKASVEANVRIDSKPAEAKLTDVLPADTARLFRSFAKTANPATGNQHPLDAQRWYSFVVNAHQQRVTLNLEFLRQWLAINTEWYEDTIVRVIGETESAMDLLDFYDSHRIAA